jgi:hypothetical protein
VILSQINSNSETNVRSVVFIKLSHSKNKEKKHSPVCFTLLVLTTQSTVQLDRCVHFQVVCNVTKVQAWPVIAVTGVTIFPNPATTHCEGICRTSPLTITSFSLYSLSLHLSECSASVSTGTCSSHITKALKHSHKVISSTYAFYACVADER